MALGSVDKKILDELQENGRMTYSELAERVGLTTTPCIERVRRLEREGYIRGYGAQLSPEKLDAGMVVFVQIRLDRNSKRAFEKFEAAVGRLSQVQECYLVTGDFDFLIKARVSGMDAYRDFLEDQLLSIAGVKDSTSIVAMNLIKETMKVDVLSKS